MRNYFLIYFFLIIIFLSNYFFIHTCPLKTPNRDVLYLLQNVN